MDFFKIQALLIAFFLGTVIHAEIKLPSLISDGMVLQRDKDLILWGWGNPGEVVTMTFGKYKSQGTTGSNGKWKIPLPSQTAGGPYSITFKGENTITIENILFGDVWLCSGQSNMANYIERVKEKYPEEVKSVNYPQLRHFFVPTKTNLKDQDDDLPAEKWLEANPEDIKRFSSVGYFFGKEIHLTEDIPVGLINSSVGGTPIEAWLSPEAVKEYPTLNERMEENKDYEAPQRSGFGGNRNSQPQDKGLAESPKWFENDYKPVGWNNYDIPGFWEDQGLKDLNGVVWFRKVVDVPKEMIGVHGNLYMGRIVDADEIYVNGIKIGNITYQYPPRRYILEPGVLKEGKNTIVIRVTNNGGKGGFVHDKPYYMTANGMNIELRGVWQYKVGQVVTPPQRPTIPQPRRWGFSAQNQPAALYNAMIAPITQFPIKGVLWYQGESNAGNPKPYREYIKSLVTGWRQAWKQELPFLVVQLANFQDINFTPEESNWAELRESQAKVLDLPKTAVATTYDIGEWNDIHPLNKKDVGLRLAEAAKALAYGKSNEYMGPVYKSHQVKDGEIAIAFDHVGGGLTSLDGLPLQRFEVADYDKHFVWADAKIEGNKVVLTSDDVGQPRYARYAWSDNPFGANFGNKDGFLALPFRTDDPWANEDEVWRGKKAAVVLTYDDAVEEHLDLVVPQLDSFGIKGTFYVTTFYDGFKNRMDHWKRVADAGHELGNHTLYHPCDGNKPGRDWLSAERDLSKYSLQRMVQEVRTTNVMLEALDGKTERTFAFTCGDMLINGVNFMDQMHDDFPGARGVTSRLNSFEETDLYNIDAFGMNGQSGKEMIALVDQAIEEGKLLVFLFHGVGGGHNLNVSLEAHRELVEYLKKRENEIYVDTMLEVAKHITLLRN